MEKFEFRTIDELGKLERGRSRHRPRNDNSLYGGIYPFIQTGDVKNASFYINSYSQTYNEKGLAQSKLWKKGTLCLTIAANIGDTCILSFDACFPDSIIGFTPYKEKSDIKFVKYCFDVYKKNFEAISKGTTQDNLSLDKLRTIKFKVPKIEIQKKIASILSAYDDLIENNNKRIAILEKMAEELYREWFVRLRFPEHEKTKIVKGIPEGWEVKKIKEIVTRKSFGKIYRESELNLNADIIVIDQSVNEFLGFYDGEPSHIATKDNPIILFGDHTCKMQLMIEKFSLAENVIPFNSKNTNATVFLFYLIKNSIETTEYKRHWTELTNKEIYLPTNKLQILFSNNVINNIIQKNKLKIINRKLKISRDKLLSRLMSGKIDVENLDIHFPPSMKEG